MIRLRSLLFYIYFGLLTTTYSTLLVLMFPVTPLRARNRVANAWGRHTLVGLKWICGLDYQASGLEHFSPEDGRGKLVLCKHQSAWETIALRGLLPVNQSWVLKRELLFIPFFGWGLASCLPIAINRGTPKQALKQLLNDGEQRLRNGDWLVIFPEGTRVPPGSVGRYASGGAQLAVRADVDVVPVAHNAGVFWKRNSLDKLPGTVQLRIGAPIASAGLNAGQITGKAKEWIENEIEKLPATADSTHNT